MAQPLAVLRRPSLVAAVLAVAGSAHGQWTAVPLHPAGATLSWATAADGDVQSGFITLGGIQQAALWHSVANPVTNLHPAGAADSMINGAHLGHQVGYATIGGQHHAGLWSGSAASFVDLHPAGFTASELLAVWENTQVGIATVNGLTRAGLWHGSAASFVDLTPPGADVGRLVAAHRDTQVGYVRYFPNFAGGLWRGSAASWVSFGPNAFPNAVYGNQQGGYYPGSDRFGTPQACFWEGTPESRVELNPINSGSSVVVAMGRGRQAGLSNVRAALWSSSRESYLDLQQFLPSALRINGRSQANAISFDANHTYVAGLVLPNGARGDYQAYLWIGPPSACFIVRAPSDALFCPRGGASFTANATGYDGPLTYQWLKDGAPIALADNPTARSATLDVAGASAAGRYACIITDRCGSVTTPEAVANVCAADVNCDNFLDFFDYDDFVAAFESGDPVSDFNGDGFLDFFDYGDFVDAFEQAC